MKLYNLLWLYETEKFWKYKPHNPYFAQCLVHVGENDILTIDFPNVLNAEIILMSKILNKSYNESIW